MINRSAFFLGKLENWLLCAIAFFFPMYKRLLPFVIAAYCLVFVLNGGLLKIIANLTDRYLLITTAFYTLLLIGISYSVEKEAAFFDVEVKFSLFLFPVIFAAKSLDKRLTYQLFFWFTIGCLAATLICFTTALVYYLDSANASVFYYQELSVFQHPSYFSMYLNFCIYLIYYYMVFDRDVNIVKSDVVMVGVIVIFAFFIVLLSSKIGLITLFMVIFAGTLLWFLKSRAIFPSIMVFIMLSGMIYFSFNYSNYIQGRIEEAVSSISDERVTFTTTGARIVIWSQSLELIKEHPFFGYGTGDVKHELIGKYREKGYDHLVELRLNAHNQFLQTIISVGILGIILLLLYLYYPMFNVSFYNNLIYMGFLGLISINLLTESMFETQAGVVFYAFFNSILYFNRQAVAPFNLKRSK
ncbi:MAG: O-antigen ligase family protein [Vicingaceae bacterium]